MSVFQRRDIITIRIGKKGLTKNTLEEVDRVLDKHGIVKIKLLKSFRENENMDREELARQVANILSAHIVGVRGFNIILKRRRAKSRQNRNQIRRYPNQRHKP